MNSEAADRYAKYGVAAPVAAPSVTPKPVSQAVASCAGAETQRKSVEEIRTIAFYENHLKRFPNCNFAALARARNEQLKKVTAAKDKEVSDRSLTPQPSA